jgi:hypothetical protein
VTAVFFKTKREQPLMDDISIQASTTLHVAITAINVFSLNDP